MDVEAEHELPLDRPRVRGLQRVVAGRSRSGPSGAAKGWVPEPARRAQPATPAASSRRAAASARAACVDRVAHRRGGLDLGGGQLRAQRDALAELRVHARGRRAAGRACPGRAASAPPRRRPCGRSRRRRARAGAALTVRHARTLPVAAIAERERREVRGACASSSSPGSCARPATPRCSAGSWRGTTWRRRAVLDLCRDRHPRAHGRPARGARDGGRPQPPRRALRAAERAPQRARARGAARRPVRAGGAGGAST